METAVKQFNSKRQIWFTQQDGKTNIGFTSNFLDTIHDCWHVTLASKNNIKTNAPLFTIETNDALFAVPSPVEGSVITFSDLAQNFPDKLTPDDVVCVIGPKEPAVKKKNPLMMEPALFPFNEIVNQVAIQPMPMPARQRELIDHAEVLRRDVLWRQQQASTLMDALLAERNNRGPQ